MTEQEIEETRKWATEWKGLYSTDKALQLIAEIDRLNLQVQELVTQNESLAYRLQQKAHECETYDQALKGLGV